jgi:hypothetical protein
VVDNNSVEDSVTELQGGWGGRSGGFESELPKQNQSIIHQGFQLYKWLIREKYQIFENHQQYEIEMMEVQIQ